jgi:hypothetical protein
MRDDPRIHKRLASKAWDGLRSAFDYMHEALLAVDGNVTAELTTIYVKYKYTADPLSQVFAVIWLKNSRCIDVALALPDDVFESELMYRPTRLRYPPLNSFVTVKAGEAPPEQFAEWARTAFHYRKSLE